MSATVSSCEKCCASIRVCSLQLFNFIDLSVGGLLVGFGLYLREAVGAVFFENINTSWLAWSSVILGGLLLLVSISSFCAITNTGCRWCAIPSAYLAVVVAFFALSLGAAALVQKKIVYNYLNDNGSNIGLSTNQIDLIKTWYQITAYVMFGLCVVELIRFRESLRYRTIALRIDGEFGALLEEDQKQWNEKLYVNKVAREEKYNDLKQHYKAKYGIGNDSMNDRF